MGLDYALGDEAAAACPEARSEAGTMLADGRTPVSGLVNAGASRRRWEAHTEAATASDRRTASKPGPSRYSTAVSQRKNPIG